LLQREPTLRVPRYAAQLEALLNTDEGAEGKKQKLCVPKSGEIPSDLEFFDAVTNCSVEEFVAGDTMKLVLP